MYSYLAKGYTTAQILSSRILREVTGAPGLALDLVLALFWFPDYTSYWAKNSLSVPRVDGTETKSTLYGVFGWIGELAGYAVGLAGAAIGVALYVPDLVLRGIIFLHEQLKQSFSDLAVFIGQTQFYTKMGAMKYPKDTIDKAYNLGVGVIGTALGIVPYTIAKAVGFVFPFLDLSYPIKMVAGFIGGVIGAVSSVVLKLPLYVLQKAIDFISIARNAVSNGVALAYASGNVSTESRYDDCVHPGELHSPQFLRNVEDYKKTPFAQLLCGPLNTDANTRRPTPRPQATTHAPQQTAYASAGIFHAHHPEPQQSGLYPSVPVPSPYRR